MTSDYDNDDDDIIYSLLMLSRAHHREQKRAEVASEGKSPSSSVSLAIQDHRLLRPPVSI